MYEMFLVSISLSISGTLMALLVFLLKPVIKNRFSKTWQYYVFLIVVLRFLLPLGPDTSLMGTVFSQIEDNSMTESDSANEPNMGNNLFLSPEEAEQRQAYENTAIPSSAAKNIGQTLIPWLWLASAVLLLLRKIVGYWRYTRFIKNRYLLITDTRIKNIYRETCEWMGVKYPPCLAKYEDAATPMLIGTMQPVIVLSDTEWKDTDIRCIFQHELTHYKRLDIVYKWLVQIMLCFHWFNPAVYWIHREINRNCELSCDEAVIKRLDEKGKYAYGDMLIGTINLDKVAARAAVSITMSEDTKLIKERLGAIMVHKKQSHIIFVLSVLLAGLLLCGSAYAGTYSPANKNTAIQNTDTLGAQSNDATSAQSERIQVNESPVSIGNVEMRYYPDGRWPYVHWFVTNHSEKTIIDYEMVLLAYDENGNPMELVWLQFPLTDGYKVTGYTSQSDKSYETSFTVEHRPILPGTTQDLNGGWSLWDGWNQEDGTHEVAYVLACMKQVTFEDDTVWENPEYQSWLSEYRGNTVGLEILAKNSSPNL